MNEKPFMVQISLTETKNSKQIPVKIYPSETTADLNQKAI